MRINALPNTPDVSNDEYVHARALRYHFEQNRIVILGSSLAYNLREVYFKEDVANLGFPGGVAVTGAELVRWSDKARRRLFNSKLMVVGQAAINADLHSADSYEANQVWPCAMLRLRRISDDMKIALMHMQ